MSFTTPESVRTTKSQTPEALAFQIASSALYLWPTDTPMTEFDAKLIDSVSRDTALTIYLQTLASF